MTEAGEGNTENSMEVIIPNDGPAPRRACPEIKQKNRSYSIERTQKRSGLMSFDALVIVPFARTRSANAQ